MTAVAAVLLTVGCATSSGTVGSPGPTAKTTAAAPSSASLDSATPSVSWSPWVDDSPPPIPTGSCGSAHLARGGAMVMDGAPALRCFTTAVKACAPASLGFSELGVDTGTEATVTTLPGTPCRASYVYDNWSGNFGGETSPKLRDSCTVQVNGQHIDFHCLTLTDEIPAG